MWGGNIFLVQPKRRIVSVVAYGLAVLTEIDFDRFFCATSGGTTTSRGPPVLSSKGATLN